MTVGPVPAEILARWLPSWRQLGHAALLAAQDPETEPLGLLELTQRAGGLHTGWPSPFGKKRDQAVQAAFVCCAQAFARQDSGAMRRTLEGVLREAALAFMARLERIAEPAADPPPRAPPWRNRRDIDGPEED